MEQRNELRKRILVVHLTPTEYADLQEQFKSTTYRIFSDYIRGLLRQEPFIKKFRNKSLDEFELTAIGIKRGLETLRDRFSEAIHLIKNFVKIGTLLYYNERKLKEKKAECIYAGNFLKDAADLTFLDKKQRFQNLLELNQRAEQTALHVVLQFPPEETLDNGRLSDIAAAYMQRIGYGDQPY